jgi:glycosyltransferase involved in cell wall biosynthesis
VRKPVLRAMITADAVGGVWQYSLDLARGLAALEVQTVLAVLGPRPDPAQRAAAAAVPRLQLVETGLPLDWTAGDCAAVVAASEALAAYAEEVGADIVQLHSAALAGGTVFPVPVVAVHHSCVATWWDAVKGGELPEDFRWRAALVADGIHAADAVITPSAAFSAAVARRYRAGDKVRTVHNGRAPLKLERRVAGDCVFTAGRLWDEAKDMATLDAAAERVAVPIHAAGPTEGPNGAVFRPRHLACLGTLGDAEMGRWLGARPVFVSTARYEPFGLAVLEAAQAGCPLVLADIPTFRELWDGAALYVAPGDSEGFCKAISALVGDDFERAVRGRAARARARLYTVDAMAAQVAAVYRSLLPAVDKPVLAATAAAA